MSIDSEYDEFLDDMYGVIRFGNLPIEPIPAHEIIRVMRPAAYETLHDLYSRDRSE